MMISAHIQLHALTDHQVEYEDMIDVSFHSFTLLDCLWGVHSCVAAQLIKLTITTYAIFITLGKDKLEDMDISLWMSAAWSWPTLRNLNNSKMAEYFYNLFQDMKIWDICDHLQIGFMHFWSMNESMGFWPISVGLSNQKVSVERQYPYLSFGTSRLETGPPVR